MPLVTVNAGGKPAVHAILIEGTMETGVQAVPRALVLAVTR